MVGGDRAADRVSRGITGISDGRISRLKVTFIKRVRDISIKSNKITSRRFSQRRAGEEDEHQEKLAVMMCADAPQLEVLNTWKTERRAEN